MNLYAYCQCDPVNKVDPSGHLAVAITCMIIGALVGLGLGLGYAVYKDGSDDGEVNGSIGWQMYVASTLFGGLLGGLIGYYIIPALITFAGTTFTIGATSAAAGASQAVLTGSMTITGAEILAGVGVLGGLIVMASRIGKSGGYRIDHYYPNDHDPIHVHVRGDDIPDSHGIRVGLDGEPLPGESKLPPGAKKALRKLWEAIIKALKPFM